MAASIVRMELIVTPQLERVKHTLLALDNCQYLPPLCESCAKDDIAKSWDSV